jgi:hypothetical protein
MIWKIDWKRISREVSKKINMGVSPTMCSAIFRGLQSNKKMLDVISAVHKKAVDEKWYIPEWPSIVKKLAEKGEIRTESECINVFKGTTKSQSLLEMIEVILNENPV